MYKLDSKPYADKIKKAREAADRLLKRYGEPRIPLAELRTRLARELKAISLTELILKEREAGW
jgi:hypothetical protein